MEKKKIQNNSKKRSKIVMTIMVIAMIMIIIGIVYYINKSNKKEYKEIAEHSLINMNNTENAEIKEGKKQNTSKKLSEEKEYKGLKIKNIKLIAEGGITKLTAEAENKSKENFKGGKITVVFLNNEGKEISRLETILPSIEIGKIGEIDAGTTADIANAYDLVIE